MKKLSIVLGIQKNISMLILDEPTNHLDVVAIRLLEKLLKDAEATVVIVSHDFDFLNECSKTNIYFQRTGNQGIIIT